MMTCDDRAPATMHTSSGSHCLDLRVADSFLSRFRGLMLAPALHSTQGLLITRCPSVHGAFMRFSIDLVYIDRDGVVTQCVPGFRPWRASISGIAKDAAGRRYRRAAHTLELAAGAIAAMDIRPGDRLRHPFLNPTSASVRTWKASQRGSAMVEFTVVGPIITLLGLATLQYGMLYFAKAQINYAGFMAAREGATANASVDSVYAAYTRALIPLYGGGQTPADLAVSLAKASEDIGANGAGNVNIELLNPTRQSFDDWNDPALQAALHTGSRRVIPNTGQAFKSLAIGPTSGQTIQDANLIKLRITHGYLPKIPLIRNLYGVCLKWLDPHTDAFHTKLLADGRIPVVTNVTLHMQSDAIEPGAPVSSPGAGNGGTPANPGDPPVSHNPPPECTSVTCTSTPPQTPPEPPRACNPLLDPNCATDPCANMCCKPG